MYQALYRKYRPANFDDVVGQNSIVNILKNSIISCRFSHAYMFFGSRGTGKTSLAKIFAKAVNCLDTIDGNPCGKCQNCVAASEKECVDILEIDAASNNGVDEIRELRNKINFVPSKLKYKVYIIDEVHMLSIGAFNALLKTLEEPPQHTIFILATTDPQKVPDTIVSRCQCFSFQRISIDMIVQRLNYICKKEQILIDQEVLKEIAISSDGGMRDSLSMLDKLRSYTNDNINLDIYTELNGLITKKDLKEFADNLFSKNLKNVLIQINAFNNSGKNLIQILSQFMYYLRDELVDYYVKNKNVYYDLQTVEKLIFTINEKMFDIKKSSNPKIYIEILLLNFMSNLEIKTMKKNNNESINDVESDKIIEANIVDKKNEEIVENNSKLANLCDEENKITNFIDNEEILNINEIIKVRVNNAFALANKKILNQEINNLKILNDYTFDQQIGYLVCELLNAKFRVASDEIIVISYEYESIVNQNLLHLEQLENIYQKLTSSSKKFAIITDYEWEQLKADYIVNLKNGNNYQILLEPEKKFKNEKNNDIIYDDTTLLFGDIVEID